MRLRGRTVSSSSTPSFSRGWYCFLSIERLRPRPKEDEEVDRLRSAPSVEGTFRACSLRNARNSAGAISGWTLAGTQKRWKGSSVISVDVSPVLAESMLLPA